MYAFINSRYIKLMSIFIFGQVPLLNVHKNADYKLYFKASKNGSWAI